MTAAGANAIDQSFGSTVNSAFLPYDYPFAVRRFLDHYKPSVGLLMETEIWPNLLAECSARALPIALANARMSERSARGYRRLSPLTRPAFESLRIVCAQTEADADRIAALGAHRVTVTGNLKFDVQSDPRLLASGQVLRQSLGNKRVLLFASTREGEEALLMRAIENRLPEDVAVVFVPRHPQRFDQVATLLSESRLSFARRSSGESPMSAMALLGDTMGEMPAYYAAADVAFVGGTLLPYGGQNFIEASAIGVPVVMGPHTHNFSEATRLAVASGAAVQVSDAGRVIEVALSLLNDPGRRKSMGEAGMAFCASHRGATERHIAEIAKLLGTPG